MVENQYGFPTEVLSLPSRDYCIPKIVLCVVEQSMLNI